MRKAWYVPRQIDGKGPPRQQNRVVLSGKELESRGLGMSELVGGKMDGGDNGRCVDVWRRDRGEESRRLFDGGLSMD